MVVYGLYLLGGENERRLFGIVGWRSSIVEGLYREREVGGSSREDEKFAFLKAIQCHRLQRKVTGKRTPKTATSVGMPII